MIFRRSLISELMNTGGGVFTVVFSIVITVGMVRVMGSVAGGKIDAGEILQMLVYSSLFYLAPLLALSAFLAVLMVMIRSWQQNEMVVWFSSGGLSLLAWIRPVVCFAVPVIILTAVLSLVIAPWARMQYELSKTQFSQRDDTTRVASGQFIETGKGQRVFFIDQVNEEEQTVKGIFVSETSGSKSLVVAADEGRMRINEQGDRYVDLGDGRRYEIAANGSSYRVADFENYSIRLDVKPDQVLTARRVQSQTTEELITHPTDRNNGQLFWRLSWPFVALNLVLLAIPLSFTNPRAGRSLNLIIAVLVFILYMNSVSVMQTKIAKGAWTIGGGLALVHGLVLCLTVILFIRRIWLERWLPRQLSPGYWRDRTEQSK